MRSRIAITLMLVLGFGFSSAGVGMAVNSVPSDATSSADAQYDRPPVTGQQPTLETPEEVAVGGETEEGTKPNKPAKGDAPTNGVAGETDEEVVQQTENRQLAAEQGAADELPFTGFAAIPVLLMGFALLTAGFALRGRA